MSNPARNGRAPCRTCGALVVHAMTDAKRLMRLEPQSSIDGDFVVWWEETEPAGKRIQRTRSVAAWEHREGRPYEGARHRAHEGNLCPGTTKQRRWGISPGSGGVGCL